MINLMTVQALGPKLIEALGAPKLCTWLELRIAFDEIPTVRCEYYPVGDDGTIDFLGKVLAEYELVPRAKYGGSFAVHPESSIEFQAAKAQVIGFDAWMRRRTEAAHQAMMAQARLGGVAYN